MRTSFVASRCCPVGCGVDVVFLAARGSVQVFCYCDLCECVWRDPADARFESGLSSIDTLSDVAPLGADSATRAQIEAAGFSSAILAPLTDDDASSVSDGATP